ncbi:hypothetical protein RRG08_011454 [Elysia crispata]|uniref:Uncharacterized protein n=1 Tax=Elysia crispata TaxID=231223 RepID=A0AAE1DM76_9GAST|nr:hypothetical protein RRG08_011454 [Elysia crispata]
METSDSCQARNGAHDGSPPYYKMAQLEIELDQLLVRNAQSRCLTGARGIARRNRLETLFTDYIKIVKPKSHEKMLKFENICNKVVSQFFSIKYLSAAKQQLRLPLTNSVGDRCYNHPDIIPGAKSKSTSSIFIFSRYESVFASLISTLAGCKHLRLVLPSRVQATILVSRHGDWALSSQESLSITGSEVTESIHRVFEDETEHALGRP